MNKTITALLYHVFIATNASAGNSCAVKVDAETVMATYIDCGKEHVLNTQTKIKNGRRCYIPWRTEDQAASALLLAIYGGINKRETTPSDLMTYINTTPKQ